MKLIKILSAIAFAASILATPTFAADKEQPLPACCAKAKKEGKECANKCCVAAKKDCKTCDKHGKK